jgi:predicted NAD-dependent protein-ADP-ribosyltransferase YbiA (DUF1768 family)
VHALAIYFYSKSGTHREFSNLALFAIDRHGARWPTGDEELIVSAPTDAYWGVDRDGTGQNKLSKIIARIRDELRASGR